MYWIANSWSRWTNAVAFRGTRLIAPPYESISSAPRPRSGFACRASIAVVRVVIAAAGSGLATKSDLARNVERCSVPRGLVWHSATVSLLQPAQNSAASIPLRVWVMTLVGVPAAASGLIRASSSASVPKNWPDETTWERAAGPVGSVASRSHTENSASGAVGAKACQA